MYRKRQLRANGAHIMRIRGGLAHNARVLGLSTYAVCAPKLNLAWHLGQRTAIRWQQRAHQNSVQEQTFASRDTADDGQLDFGAAQLLQQHLQLLLPLPKLCRGLHIRIIYELVMDDINKRLNDFGQIVADTAVTAKCVLNERRLLTNTTLLVQTRQRTKRT